MTISYDDAYKESLDYFGGDELATKVWIDKYALRDNDKNLLEKTPTDMHWRLANEFARIEKNKFKDPLSAQEIFNYLDHFKYIIPQGGILYGLGNPYQYVTLSNCYVIDRPQDSYAGICWTDEQILQISKRRGGCGTDLSLLRPTQAPTQNSSRSSTGPVSFAKRFSHSIREVGQDGRRGALLLMMKDKHPDVSTFIQSKKNNKEITGANLSVALRDEFIEKALTDKEYIQQWPINSNNPQSIQTIKAKELWDTIIKTAWETAEPGVLFWDTIINESISDCYSSLGFETIATNPSLRGETLVLTNNGVYPIKELADTQQNIVVLNCNKEWKSAQVFCSGKNKQLMKITFTNNSFVYCTPEHKWPILNTLGRLHNKQTGQVIKKLTTDLKRQDKIYLPSIENPINNNKCLFTNEDGFVLGWLYGDGWQSWHINQQRFVLGFIFNTEDVKCGIAQRVLNYTNKLARKPSTLKQDHGSQSWTYQTSDPIVIKHFQKLGANYKKNGLPISIWKSNHNFIKGFIDGLFSSDGYIECSKKSSGNNRIILTTAHKFLSQQLRQLLMFYGIRSTTRYQKSHLKNTTKEYYRYDVVIGGLDTHKFSNIFTLSNNKNNILKDIIKQSTNNYSNNRNYLVVKTIENTDIFENVYDITVNDDTHTFMTEVGITGNCSELPLPALDSCRLLLLNLYSFVVHPFTKNAYFDYSLYYKSAQIAQRMMDNVIDLELECINKIIQKINNDPESLELKDRELKLWQRVYGMCKNGRRTGTGNTALADTLAALGIKYGSKASLKEIDQIFKTFKFACFKSSVDMAKELGTFPIWNKDLEKDNPFLNRIKDEKIEIDGKEINGLDLYNDIQQYGRRNIVCLTMSPAGTISIETQTTSGCEPLLYFSMKRRKKGNLADDNFRSDFVDQSGDHWMEFELYHPKLVIWSQITGKTDIKDSPWYGCCAEDLDYLSRIKVQSAIQKHIDHSISSTINLPENTSVETVAKIYEEAWKHKCKGITIYRKNCRTGVILDNTTKSIPIRPKELPCDVHHVSVHGQKYFVLIGLENNKPIECFAGKNGILDKEIKSGKIVKRKKNFYSFTATGSEEPDLSPITASMNEMERAISRLLSGLLRSNASIDFIVRQLEKTGETEELTSFTRCLARVLKHYIKDGNPIDGENCPECQAQIIRKDGCWVCSVCDYSKCM